jgi:ATP-dependent DNA helicase RecQ
LFAEAQGVPPYVIFHDSTLVEMCSAVPQTLDEFATLSGVGERKLLKYGEAFLATIHSTERQTLD